MSVESLWAPWRLDYVAGDKPPAGCVFCEAPHGDHAEHGILAVTDNCFAILNRYPYTNGHVLVLPKAHLSDLTELSPTLQAELHALMMDAVAAVKRAYGCPALNIGMNMGAAAGAGIAGHLHYHVVPRWHGDTNFMPVVGGTKVIPESLDATYARLKAAWTTDG